MTGISDQPRSIVLRQNGGWGGGGTTLRPASIMRHRSKRWVQMAKATAELPTCSRISRLLLGPARSIMYICMYVRFRGSGERGVRMGYRPPGGWGWGWGFRTFGYVSKNLQKHSFHNVGKPPAPFSAGAVYLHVFRQVPLCACPHSGSRFFRCFFVSRRFAQHIQNLCFSYLRNRF